MSEQPKIVFKKKRVNKSFRTKDSGDEGEEGDAPDTATNIEELKEIQRLKKRVNRGVNVVDLLSAAPSVVKEPSEKKEAKYGLVDSKTLVNELDLGNTFSAETNRRDEDADMMKFIEEELAKRKGAMSSADSDQAQVVAKTTEDIVFNELPKHLLADNKAKNEEMLSNQMLSGIPEIDLGVSEKIRNIEATEEAKVKLLENRRKRKDGGNSTDLIPTNIAVNFVQHNRYNVPESAPTLATAQKKQRPQKPTVSVIEEPVVVIGEEPRQRSFKQHVPHGGLKHPGKEKATDDYHFDRFRKQFRK